MNQDKIEILVGKKGSDQQAVWIDATDSPGNILMAIHRDLHFTSEDYSNDWEIQSHFGLGDVSISSIGSGLEEISRNAQWIKKNAPWGVLLFDEIQAEALDYQLEGIFTSKSEIVSYYFDGHSTSQKLIAVVLAETDYRYFEVDGLFYLVDLTPQARRD